MRWKGSFGTRSLRVVFLLSLLFGCTRYNFYIPKHPEEEPMGSTIRIYQKSKLIVGEFIAYQRDTIFVRSFKGEFLRIPLSEVGGIELFLYDRGAPTLTILGGIGLMLLSITHGWYSAITFPTAIAVTLVSASIDTRKYRYEKITLKAEEVKSEKVEKLGRLYSRFPQGLPEGFRMGGNIKEVRP